jgi:hypothetical protein
MPAPAVPQPKSFPPKTLTQPAFTELGQFVNSQRTAFDHNEHSWQDAVYTLSASDTVVLQYLRRSVLTCAGFVTLSLGVLLYPQRLCCGLSVW